MKTMNLKAISSALMMAAILFVSQANAQNDAPKHAHPHNKEGRDHSKKHIEWMKTELSLTDDQTAKVEKINQKYSEKRKAMHEEQRKQMKALREEHNKELKSVLNKDQYAKLEAKKAEMKEKRKHPRSKKDCKGTNK
jgi:Spy/CpxP family protein refolding chaperone